MFAPISEEELAAESSSGELPNPVTGDADLELPASPAAHFVRDDRAHARRVEDRRGSLAHRRQGRGERAAERVAGEDQLAVVPEERSGVSERSQPAAPGARFSSAKQAQVLERAPEVGGSAHGQDSSRTRLLAPQHGVKCAALEPEGGASFPRADPLAPGIGRARQVRQFEQAHHAEPTELAPTTWPSSTRLGCSSRDGVRASYSRSQRSVR